ncbi:MAG: sarcosine oxidase subunit gamma family protein [Pseudomonadota bacterium]
MSDASNTFAVWRSGAALDAMQMQEGLSVRVEDRGDIGMLDLRLKSKSDIDAASKALGFDLPTKARTSAGTKGIACLWFSVDQWIVVLPRHQLPSVLEKLSPSLADTFSSIVDVSDMRSVLRVSGSGAQSVLMKSTSVDVFDGAFAPGHVRRVSFGEIAAAVHVIDETSFDLYVFRSYVEYALDWISEAAAAEATLQPFSAQGPVAV